MCRSGQAAGRVNTFKSRLKLLISIFSLAMINKLGEGEEGWVGEWGGVEQL